MKPQGRPRINTGTCCVAGCEKKSHSRRYCRMHYARYWRHGSPHFVYAKHDKKPKKNYLPFDPKFHHNHRRPFTESDLEYLCRYFEVDELRSLSYAMGRTEYTLVSKVQELKRKGLYEYYKTLNKHW